VIRTTRKSSKSVGAEFWPGQKLAVNKGGLTTLYFPLKAGYYRAGACTELSLSYSYFQNGALKIGLFAGQKWFCKTPSRTTFAVRRPNNPETEYRIGSNGNIGIVRAPQRLSSLPGHLIAARDVIPPLENIFTSGTFYNLGELTYIGVSRGQLDLETKSGAKATATEGDTAIMSKNGIQIYRDPIRYQRVNLSGDRSRFYTDPSSLVYIDGIYREQGRTVWNPRHIRIESISGRCYEEKLTPVWPKLTKK
jgi:hypothetical protein